MSSTKLFSLLLCAALGFVAVGSFAIADSSKETKPAGQPEMKLPPGWTMDDMQACMLAATPGKQQQHLAKEAGVWKGKTTMFMPGAEPMTSECVSTITSIMDGRFIKCEIKGDMPGMGPYEGLGLYGYDNVSKKFVSTWVDTQRTGMMNGIGELSDDGKALSWKYTFNCPVTKQPAILREIETTTGPNTKRLDMFGTDPKTGKESKMMTIEFTRKS